MKIKSLLLTIVVIFTFFTSTSCREKNREYDEAVVIAAAEELIEKSKILNEIYYGKGIAYELVGTDAYRPADIVHLNQLKISTIDDLKAKTMECFTDGYSKEIFKTKLSPIIDEENGLQSLTRYYQKVNADGSPECIMVYVDAIVYFTDDVSFDYTTLKVSRVKGQTVYITVSLTVTNSEGKTQTTEKEIALIEEAAGWRIDSPTYAKYIDDKYKN